MRTADRVRKLKRVIDYKQTDLTVVFDNIHDPHNISAVMRTCESVGVNDVHIIDKMDQPSLGKRSSASAVKWLNVHNHTSFQDFAIRMKGSCQIISTVLDDKATSVYDIDLTKPTAIVLGNEKDGISNNIQTKSDLIVKVPMFGLIQSLNVSVAAAVILYEALRQRLSKSLYPNNKLELEWKQNKLESWMKK